MYKSKLQELCHERKWEIPQYKTTKQGQDHCPRFQATVTVHGSSFQSQSLAKSSKQAQSDSAKLAFDYFSSSSSSSPSFSCFPNVNVDPRDVWTAGKVQQAGTQETSVTPEGNGTASATGANNVYKLTDMQQHDLFKNLLQSYAQKRNLSLPVYSSERKGPPHASLFKSIVTIDGQTYESEEYLPSLYRAENAAAKAALMSLSPDGVQADESSYKNLVQELAHKEGFRLPVYSTKRSGEAHMPTFVSTVEIRGEYFTGQESRTKKQAEMSAAKVAYTALKQCDKRQDPACLAPATSQVQEAPKLSTSSLLSLLTAYLEHHVQPKLPVPNEKAEEEGAVSSCDLPTASAGPESNSAKRVSPSAISGSSNSCLPEHNTSSSSSSSSSSPSLPASSPTNLAISSTIERLLGMSTLCQNSVVHLHQAKVTNSTGSNVLPISNTNLVEKKIIHQSMQ